MPQHSFWAPPKVASGRSNITLGPRMLNFPWFYNGFHWFWKVLGLLFIGFAGLANSKTNLSAVAWPGSIALVIKPAPDTGESLSNQGALLHIQPPHIYERVFLYWGQLWFHAPATLTRPLETEASPHIRESVFILG